VLPTNWNGRFLYQGGGGLNGSVGEPLGIAGAGDVPALARGFAIISTDSGHKGAVFDAAFMRDQQAALDFAYNSVGKVTETGKALTTEFYGRSPDKTYSAGCSTGGREGMLAAQSYPMLFDGVVAGAPAMMTGHSNLALLNAAVAFNQIAPNDAQGHLLPAQAFSAGDKKLLSEAVANQCDGMDGLKDGLIQNLNACHFDPAVLQCRGTKGADCLSSAQVKALHTSFGGPRESNGKEVYVRFPYDLGLVGGPTSNAISFLPGGAPSPVGPPSQALQIDVDQELAKVRADDMQNLTDTAFWTNLSTFYGRGGRIIFFHGASDPWFSTFATEAYEQRLKKDNPGVDGSRFYNVPSMSHCSGGGLDRFDLLGALVDWVEKGVAPTRVAATSPAFPGRSRPLCPAPQYAHYKGSGDPQDGANFECRIG
jgi:feruloyl esterase